MLSNSEYLASDYQHTLKDSISLIGRGLHSGLQVIMTLMPADEFSVDMLIDFDDPVIGRQSMAITVNEEVFSQQLAPTRTLGADSGIAEHCLKIYQIL